MPYALWLAPSSGNDLFLIGAARLTLAAGSVTILGGKISTDGADVFSPPHDKALRLTVCATLDLRLLTAVEKGVSNKPTLFDSPVRAINNDAKDFFALRAQRAGACLLRSLSANDDADCEMLSPSANFQRAVVCVEPIVHMRDCLAEYDLGQSMSTSINDATTSPEVASCALAQEGLIPIEPACAFVVPGACLLRTDPALFTAAVAKQSDEDAITLLTRGNALLRQMRPALDASCRVCVEFEDGTIRPLNEIDKHISTLLPKECSFPSPLATRMRCSARTISPPVSWQQAFVSISEDFLPTTGVRSCTSALSPYLLPSVIACGRKGVGKSMFLRFVTNILLSKQPLYREESTLLTTQLPKHVVCFLDLDPGQPEHCPPGLLALSLVDAPILSPAHVRTHHSATSQRRDTSNRLFRCASLVSARFVGSASCREDPAGFFRSACSLVDDYRSRFAPLGVPLVVNSHGWQNGFGLETLQSIVNYLRPTHLVSLNEGSSSAPTQYVSVHGRDASDECGLDVNEGQWLRFGEDSTFPGTSPLFRNLCAPVEHAWQPPPPPGRRVTHFPCQSLSIAAWHLSIATTVEAPPRATRSPSDLRSARLLTYFLAGLGNADDHIYSQCIKENIFFQYLDSRHNEADNVFWAAVSDQREARACLRGDSSPAFHFGESPCFQCPATDIAIFASASERLSSSRISETVVRQSPIASPGWLSRRAISESHASLCEAAVGQLVGLCSSSLIRHASSDDILMNSATPAIRAGLFFSPDPCASDLICLGLGFVRKFDRSTGLLHIASPLSLSALESASINSLVLWSGSGGSCDIPAQLLFCDSPTGDAFCFAPALVLAGAGEGAPNGMGVGKAARGGLAEGRGLAASHRRGAAGRRGLGRKRLG